MAITELVFGITIGMIVLISMIGIITVFVTKKDARNVDSIRNVYLGHFENSNESIQSAMLYLKLTNGIEQRPNHGQTD